VNGGAIRQKIDPAEAAMPEFTLTVEPGTPARVISGHAARVLGVNETDVATLIRARLLKPLGAPMPCAPKYFATCELVRLANDPQWLDRATRAITQYWKNKNSRRADRRRSTPA
jgi:hypothetical protein